MNIQKDKVNTILATDCGSTTTKAILIEKKQGEYRWTYRGEAQPLLKRLLRMSPEVFLIL